MWRKLNQFKGVVGAIILCAVLAIGVTTFPEIGFAQVDQLSEIQDTVGLGTTSPGLIVARLIRTALGVLGIIAVLITMYGGFTWMTAGGSAEKVDRAKRILTSGAIGLAIILTSFGITVFVINSLLNATGAGGGGSSSSDGGGGGLGGGSGSPTAGFVVTSIAPDSAVPIRNIAVQVVTNRRIDADSVANAVTVTEVGGSVVPGSITISNNRITFTPEAACPEPNEDYNCFGENTQYQVEVNSSLKDTSGRDLDCTLDRCLATFETGSLVDTEDPSVTYEFPYNGTTLIPNADIITRASATDDSGVALIEFSAGGVVYDSVPVTELLQSATLETLWNNTGYSPGARYSLEARAIDLAGNEDDDSVAIRVGPAHCYDGQQNEGETGLDCGGECGSCGGSQCTEDTECSSGSCVNGTCEGGTGGGNGAAATENNPIIYSISPAVGAIGEVITITGSSFGSTTGKVEFKNPETGDTAIGSLEFPLQCGNDFWDPNQVLVRVPETYLSSDNNPQPIEIANHELRVIAQNGRASDAVSFAVRTGEAGPGICNIIENPSNIGDDIEVVGLNFGSAAGEVVFHDAISVQMSSSEWSSSSIETTVPQGATTGNLTVKTPSGRESNPVQLRIGSTDTDANDSTLGAAAYAWSFSTGRVPEKPQLVVECSEERVSSVPNNQFTDGAVCVNAKVYAEFTTLIDHTSLIYGNTVRVDECRNENCTQTTLVSGDFIASDQVDRTSISFVPDYSYNDGRFAPDTLYKVTVTGSVRSEEGVLVDTDASYTFTTRNSSEDCAIEDARVAPRRELFEEENMTGEFLALAMFGECQPLNGDSFNWNWGVTESIATIDVGSCEEEFGNDCATVTAFSEGTGVVTVEESVARVGDEADITVNFADPYVAANYPTDSCLETCTDAYLGADFNISMDPSSFAGNVTIQECRNELCGHFVGPNLYESADCLATDANCKELKFTINNTLKVGTYYRVTISGAVTSESGVALTRTNYGQDYSWTFKVRDENASCRLSRFDLRPEEALLREIGDTQAYSIAAYGTPDSCSVAGQRLNTTQYNWSWETPIVDDAGVAKWVTAQGDDGLMSSAASIPLGCTETCLPMGSSSIAATCGDGIISRGEECEDGNTENGDGCSAQCLREGGDVVGECGNGVLERLASGAGEDCDDGNLVDGDGCSALCLNEGSSSIGICGDGRLDVSVISGGEDCDDGNLVNGDGCSSQCQAEGAGVSVAGQPICGDGEIDAPYESCDDGNTIGGDGCSARCIQDGRYVKATNPDGSLEFSICGNGFVETNLLTGAGEACDDGNTLNGDGCSSSCRLEGSSLNYANPSFCGDGLVSNNPPVAGAGEYALCEVGVTAASTSASQLAEIIDGASAIVAAETNRATSTIRVQEIDTGLTADASLALTCSARNDNDCSDPALYGVGDNACCSLRPTVRLEPVDGEQNVCRNVAAVGFFSMEMDARSLEENAYLELLLGEGELCPAGHEILDLANNGDQARGFFRSLKNLFSRVLGTDVIAAADGSCVMPISSVEQVALPNGEYKVNFVYRGVLQPSADYELFIGSSAKSKIGVQMGTDTYTRFTTATEICAVTDVTVIDTSEITPGYFFSSGETHPFKAAAYSRRSGQLKEIQQVPGTYEWQWRDWIEDSSRAVVTVQNENGAQSADVTSSTSSGYAHVAGGLEITVDQPGIHSGQAEPVRIAGAKRVETIICDNPWPIYSSSGAYPFMDTPESTLPGVMGTGGQNDDNWMYFSTSYCRDAGSAGTTDDLPSLSIVSPNRTEQNVEDIGVLKEYILRVNDSAQSGDAIGIRVSKNLEYLSPLDWYFAQGFTGAPTVITVDGFQAIQDGRTVYVSAPNVDVFGNAYTNIYVISYNEGATDETREIYAQLLENFSFLVNKSDAGFCSVNGSLTDTTCSVDSDCSVGFCANEKSQIRRDVKRINDLMSARSAINASGSQNPTLEAGTTIRGLTSSAWNSWTQTLGADVGNLSVDPLNTYNGCGSANLLGYSTETCINENTGNYVCPAGSFVYHYKAEGSNGYSLYGQLESASTNWVQPIIGSENQRGQIVLSGSASTGIGFVGTSPICSAGNAVFGASSSCGDGVVGPGEVCEIGQRGGGEFCQAANGESGVRDQICNATCTGFVTDPGAVCVAPMCGNGVIDEGEQCDDADRNGEYGFCGEGCTFATSLSCGDGTLTPGSGEACDCSINSNSLQLGGRNFGGNGCFVQNGTYASNPANSCAWDCSGPAGFCGDGVIQAGEQCDGNIEEWSGKLCTRSSNNGAACTTDDDCLPVWNNGQTFPGRCGNYNQGESDISEFTVDACPVARVCISGDASKQGSLCTTDADCSTPGTSDGDCSANAVQTTRTKTCEDNGAGGEICTWANGVGDSWSSIACKGSFTCGNGILDPGEQCDDGNDSNADSCTRECKLNVCGDGYIHQGVEACDAGDQNGQACTAAYGSSCTSCTVQCTTTSSTGAFCGNNIREGGEFCDGTDVQFRYVSDQGELYPDDQDTTINEQMCAQSLAGTRIAETNSNQAFGGYECRQVGMCNGGSENGSVCFAGMQAPDNGITCEQGGGTCVYEQCDQSCGLTCPFNTSPQLLRLATASSTQRRTTIELNSYTNSEGEVQPQNAGSIIIPACTVAEDPVLDIDYRFNRETTYVVFLTDLSGSMITGNRIGLTKQALRNSVESLTNELAGDVQISLVGYTGDRSVTSDNGIAKYQEFYDIATLQEASQDDSLTTCYDAGDPAVDETSRFCSWSDTVDLQVAINDYAASGVTNTKDGMLAAMELLDQNSLESGRKIMVMLSDGDPTTGQNPDQPYDRSEPNHSIVDEIRSRDIEIYTVAVTNDDSLIGDMTRWSSGDISVWDPSFNEPDYSNIQGNYDSTWDAANEPYGGFNSQVGIDYAYSLVDTNADSISRMYRSIVDSITSIGLTLTSGTSVLGQTVQEGASVRLKLPESFQCLDREQQLPIRINFNGVGTVQISNARFNMCLPN